MKETILKIVCWYCDISREQFFTKRRRGEIIRAKRLFAALIKDLYCFIGTKEISDFIGCSKWTVTHHQRRHEEIMSLYLQYRREYKILKDVVDECLLDDLEKEAKFCFDINDMKVKIEPKSTTKYKLIPLNQK